MTDRVHLGFEVGADEAVEIPIAHMVVTGMTQQAGKTTALEALIQRSGRRAVTFVTKRGERAFSGGRRLPPFFRERADWVFVASLIDATLGEKNKLLRAWLMKVCRGTSTLAEVQANVRKAKDSARGFAESIYTEIDGYLELVVPQLAQLPPARAVEIGPGLNVMDLSKYSTELQALVIKSVLEHVYEHETGVITVIPEAWEFLPEGRGSPVKREAETLIRKGAALGNFVWLDSQDLAGVWKLAVRAAPVYLIGVQREANEIKRTLANIPGSVAKPKASQIATLQRGQFYACHGTHSTKTYVQPAWLDEQQARDVARRETTPAARPVEISVCGTPPPPPLLEAIAAAARASPAPPIPEEDFLMSTQAEQKLDEILTFLRRGAAAQAAAIAAGAVAPSSASGGSVDEESLYQRFKERLAKEAPQILQVLTKERRLELVIEPVEPIRIDGESLKGWIGRLIVDGFFDNPRSNSDVVNELGRRGRKTIAPRISEALADVAALGFITKEADGYQAVRGMKTNIVRV